MFLYLDKKVISIKLKLYKNNRVITKSSNNPKHQEEYKHNIPSVQIIHIHIDKTLELVQIFENQKRKLQNSTILGNLTNLQ